MTTFGILFVQKRPLKDGHQNFVQNWTARVVNSLVIIIVLYDYFSLWYHEMDDHIRVNPLSLRTIDAFPYNVQNITMGLSQFAHFPVNRLQ